VKCIAADDWNPKKPHLSAISRLSPRAHLGRFFRLEAPAARIASENFCVPPAPTSDLFAMSFTLSMSGVIVGRSELETRDPIKRVARGVFRPGLGYELAEPIFNLSPGPGGDADTQARYRKAKDALQLQLADSLGKPISVRDLHIRRESSASPAKSELIIEIETDDPAVWNGPASP